MELNKKNVRMLMLLITFAAIVFALTQHLNSVFGAVRAFLSVFSTIFGGLAIAFVLNVPLRALENRVFRGMRESKNANLRRAVRPLALVLSIVLVIGVITLAIVVVLPKVITTVGDLTGKMSGYVTSTIDWLESVMIQLNLPTDVISNLTIDWETTFTRAVDFLSTGASTLVGKVTNIGAAIAGYVADLAFGVVIAVYVLAQKESIGSFVKRVIVAALPEKSSSRILHIGEQANETFSNFVSGQLTEACILGGLCYIGMRIFRFPNPEIVGITVGVMALVPIVGAFIGCFVGAFLTLMVSPLQALLFVVFFLILQQIEGNLIYPHVVGRAVGLPGVLTISAVVVGTSVGGIIGALISVPVCAVLYTLLREGVAAVEARRARGERQSFSDRLMGEE